MSEDSNKEAMNQEEANQEYIFRVSAIIALLEQKGLLPRKEVLDEVQGLKSRKSR